MPDQSSAAQEHALIQEVTEPLRSLPEDPMSEVADAQFATAMRGYDRVQVDAYVRHTSQLVAELQARSSPQAAIRRALERVGEEVSGILQRAHDTAEEITSQSRREAEDRLERARVEADAITSGAAARVKELDADADRIWSERDRIVGDARELARQLVEIAEDAQARFPAADVETKEAQPTSQFPPVAEVEEPEPSGGEAPEDRTQAFEPFDVDADAVDAVPGELRFSRAPRADG